MSFNFFSMINKVQMSFTMKGKSYYHIILQTMLFLSLKQRLLNSFLAVYGHQFSGDRTH